MRALITLLAISAPSLAAQQPPPPVRPLGPIVAVSKDSLASVAQAVQVSGGRVYVNDIRAKRVVLFDSTLSHARVVADSTGATAEAYGDRAGTLLVYRGDSVVQITPASLSMLVLSPEKGIARTLAMPTGRGMANGLIGSIFGTPGFDSRGRLAQYMAVFRDISLDPHAPGAVVNGPDSAVIVRTDLATRLVDTVGYYRIPKDRAVVNPNGQAAFRRTTLMDNAGNRVVFGATSFPPQTIDDWAVTHDGSIAIVRGRDYHVDWLGADGHWTSSPRMPFTWQPVSDERKQFLLDSVVAAHQEMLDSMMSRREKMIASGAVSCGRGGCAQGPAGPPPQMERPIALRAQVADVPDYEPPFGQGAVRGDADNNLWIQTTTRVEGRPVYDIVDRKGELVDRVQLPPFRTIAGFGPGVVYLAVLDSTEVVHLEKARVKR